MLNNITTSTNTTLPIGMIQDYNNTNASFAVKTYRLETSNNPLTFSAKTMEKTSFAQIIYGDGPYSLVHPNTNSDILCQNIDITA